MFSTKSWKHSSLIEVLNIAIPEKVIFDPSSLIWKLFEFTKSPKYIFQHQSLVVFLKPKLKSNKLNGWVTPSFKVSIPLIVSYPELVKTIGFSFNSLIDESISSDSSLLTKPLKKYSWGSSKFNFKNTCILFIYYVC